MSGIPTLDTIPFDIIYQIATLLDATDYVQLSHTNRAIYAQLNVDSITRSIIKVRDAAHPVRLAYSSLAYSREGRAALAAQSGYPEAIRRWVNINEAVATAAPYAVAVLAYATHFLYYQGILCYHVEHEIRLLDVYHAGRQERLLDLRSIIPRLDSSSVATSVAPLNRINLLFFNNEILVFRFDASRGQDSWLIAIDTALQPARRKRLLLQRSVPASAPIFVRHTQSYLWYGIFSATLGSEGGWSCYGVDMTTDEARNVHLKGVVEGEIGQTLCFEMYQDHLYAVSTHVTYDDDEHISFYHWFCYSPQQKSQKWRGRIWRRNHREGPINEMWTDLSIRFDQTTGGPIVVECRREWSNGNSENHRTIYLEALPTPAELRLNYPRGDTESHSWSDGFNEALGGSEMHHMNTSRPKKRLRRNFHPEYESNDPSQRREFIPAQTKHHCYHLAASTFIDIVNDPERQANGAHIRDSLRLRTISRKRKSPIDEKGIAGKPGLLYPPTQFDANGCAVEGSDECFASRGMNMWPTEDALTGICHLLCPSSCSGRLRAILDEGTLVYSVSSPGLPPGHQAIILISFDPMLHIPTLTPLALSKDRLHLESPFPVALTKPTESSRGVVKQAVPLYRVINRGCRLR